jgi:cytochrome c peroxidase
MGGGRGVTFGPDRPRRGSLLALSALVAGLVSVTACGRPPAPALELVPLVAHVAGRGPSPEVTLGVRLFFDPKLSIDGSVSCATCHQPGQGFSNGAAVGTGVGGQMGNRSVPTVYAAAHNPFQFWDGRATTLEQQALMPITNPLEMGETLPAVVAKLGQDAGYKQLFQVVYGGPPTAQRLGKAIASFERALTADRSPFDRFIAGDAAAMTAQQQRGWAVFQDRGRCIECHKLPDFTDNTFHNLGVGTDKVTVDVGRQGVTGKQSDWAAFKTPTLRNITRTAPYMHDGSEATLTDMVRFYDRGGLENPNLDAKMKPIHLMVEEREDLLAFLDALSSPDNLKDLVPQSYASSRPPSRR